MYKYANNPKITNSNSNASKHKWLLCRLYKLTKLLTAKKGSHCKNQAILKMVSAAYFTSVQKFDIPAMRKIRLENCNFI